MDAFEDLVGVVAFLEEDDAFDDIVAVDDAAVFVLDDVALIVELLDAGVGTGGEVRLADGSCGETAGLADLAEANLGALYDGGDVFDVEGGAGLSLEQGVFYVVDVAVEADLADVDLLPALLDEVAAGVDVVVGDLLLDLADGEAVGDEFIGVDADLVLAGDAAEAGDIDDAGDGLELLLELPVLEGLEGHAVVGGVGGAQGVPVDLADGAPVGAHLGLQARGKGDLAEALKDLVAILLVERVVVEDEGDAGEAGEGSGAEVLHVGDAGHLYFDRDGDLLLNLFGGAAGPLGDDLDVVVGDVGVGFDRKVVEGDDAPAGQQDGCAQHQPSIVESKVDETFDHWASSADSS